MKTVLLFTVAFALGMSPAGFAAAQSGKYPVKPIGWIVLFPPGGSVDILARLKNEMAKWGKVIKERGMRAD